MAGEITEEDLWKAIAKVKYPAIDRTLVNLEMIKDIKIEEDKAIILIVLPFPRIPIINKITKSVRELIEGLGLKADVKFSLMDREEREALLKRERDTLKGL